MPNAALVTPLLREGAGVEHALALTWAERGDPVPTNARPPERDTGPVLHYASLMTMPSAATTVAGAARPFITFGGAIADVDLTVPLFVYGTRQALEPTFAEQFQELRGRLRLPVHKCAALLGTSRRTLYHWLETDRPQEQALWRIDRLIEWIADIEDRLPPAELRRLMDPDVPGSIAETLVTQGDEAASHQLHELLTTADRTRRGRRLPAHAVDHTVGEPPTLAANELRAALAIFAAPRQLTKPREPWTPRELTDTTADDAA